jgi:hypothetical protein
MLAVPNAQFRDHGVYSVIVSNDVGTATSDGAALFVIPSVQPTFITQPQSRTVTVGQTVQFSADAIGVTPMNYQWFESSDGGANWDPVVDGVVSGSMTSTLTITNVTIGLNNYRYRVTATNAAGMATSLVAFLNVLPANLITNGTFDTGDITGWSWFDNSPNPDEMLVSGGEFQWNRPATSTFQAVIFQETGVAVTGTPLAAQFDLGNSANIRQRVSVLMIDANFSDLSVCTFWLDPGAPMRTYRMRTHTTKPWANAAIYFYAATNSSVATSGGYLKLDNVSMNFNPTGSNLRTDCEDPTSPAPPGGAPSANVITNGTFASGMTGWSALFTIMSQVSDGVFEFVRTAGPPGSAAGVVVQTTGAAATDDDIITATFDLGNSSPVRKRVTLLLHSNDFSDLTACTFWLPPGLPLSTYQVKMRTTKAWAAGVGTGITFALYGGTVGLDQWIRLDNVVVQRTPATAVVGTECLEPGEALPPGLMASVASGGLQGAPPPPSAETGGEVVVGGSRPAGDSAFARLNFEPGATEWLAGGDGRGSRLLRWRRPVELGGLSGATLTFLSLVEGGAGLPEVQVSVDGVLWQTLARIPPDDRWTQVDVDLSAFAGQRIYVQFAYTPLLGETAAWRLSNVRVMRRD